MPDEAIAIIVLVGLSVGGPVLIVFLFVKLLDWILDNK